MFRGAGLAFLAVVLCGCAAAHSSQPGTLGSVHPATCRWRRVPTPNPKAGNESQLVAVTAPGPRAAWAVGNDFSGHEGGRSGPIVERWDGTRWTLVPDAARPGVFLADVSADSARDVWIAGSAHDGDHVFVARWDGGAWRRARVPVKARYGHLFGIDALAPNDVWAVGNRSNGRTGRTLVLHWNGVRWSVIASPSPSPSPLTGHPYATLESVDAVSPSDIWAVGETTNVAPEGQSATLILHWDGTRWSRVPSPDTHSRSHGSFDLLFSVDAAGPHNVWAAGSWNSLVPGFGGGGDHALLEHWDGSRWRMVATPVCLRTAHPLRRPCRRSRRLGGRRPCRALSHAHRAPHERGLAHARRPIRLARRDHRRARPPPLGGRPARLANSRPHVRRRQTVRRCAPVTQPRVPHTGFEPVLPP